MSPSGGGMVCSYGVSFNIKKLSGRCGMHYSIEDLFHGMVLMDI